MMTPDLDRPVGGVKIHYQVVDALNRVGVDAQIVHRKPGFRCSWFENSTRVTDVESLTATRNDLIVVPEEWVAFIPDLPEEIPKVVFHQNAYSTFSWGADFAVIRDVLNRSDVKRLVVVSEDNASYLRYAFPDVDVQRMRYTIDETLFSVPAHKKRQIAYMPRRRFQELNDVLSLLRSRDALAAVDCRPDRQHVRGAGGSSPAGRSHLLELQPARGLAVAPCGGHGVRMCRHRLPRVRWP